MVGIEPMVGSSIKIGSGGTGRKGWGEGNPVPPSQKED